MIGTGTATHIDNRLKMVKQQTNKIKRFNNLDMKMKMHLYKVLIRPFVEYPVVPIVMASKTSMLKMQRVQNRNLRFIVKNEEVLRNTTIQESHQYF